MGKIGGKKKEGKSRKFPTKNDEVGEENGGGTVVVYKGCRCSEEWAISGNKSKKYSKELEPVLNKCEDKFGTPRGIPPLVKIIKYNWVILTVNIRPYKHSKEQKDVIKQMVTEFWTWV